MGEFVGFYGLEGDLRAACGGMILEGWEGRCEGRTLPWKEGYLSRKYSKARIIDHVSYALYTCYYLIRKQQ
jgi:hypothetical protein